MTGSKMEIIQRCVKREQRKKKRQAKSSWRSGQENNAFNHDNHHTMARVRCNNEVSIVPMTPSAVSHPGFC